MKKGIILSVLAITLTFSNVSMIGCSNNNSESITFNEVSVHDPAIIKSNDTYYITGSHMAEAKSSDLINWTSISDSVNNQKLFKNIKTELGEALAWGKTNTFWASDWIQLSDGRYYLYYCVCEGNSPQSAIGYAVSDSVEGPYEDLGILLKSSGSEPLKYEEADGTTGTYDANVHPNAIDPAAFFDAEGRLWMMYGSYSGGIYILELDTTTGKPKEGQGTYGKKILGGYHSEIEASYVTYSKETGYYYLFLSFGGLTADAGYNMRICRSKKPDGPYYDSMGNDMIDCKGVKGQFLEAQNDIITNYGVKLFGNFKYPDSELSEDITTTGYVSAGHNSVYYDKEKNQYFLIFHTRFPEAGEMHQVRVHQMFLNEDGWFVVAPYRYSGEKIGSYNKKDVQGKYKFINHGHDITSEIKEFTDIQLKRDGKIAGTAEGTWKFTDGNKIKLNIDNIEYTGVVLEQYDINRKCNTMTFTVSSAENGVSLWGIKEK